MSSAPDHEFGTDHAFVVLGASGAIGSAVCDGLAARGARLVLAGRHGARLRALAPRTASMTFELDATSFDDVDRCLQAAAEFGGGIAGVAHCVGSLLVKPAHRTSRQEWNDVLASNLTSAFAVVRAAGAHMAEGGSVVLCSTAAARVGLAGHEAIAAAKAGVEGLVRAAAATYARRGLRFHAVAPGLVRTPLSAPLTEHTGSLEHAQRMHALGRVGAPTDVARAILWLLDPANGWLTGDVLAVDGGLANVRALPKG